MRFLLVLLSSWVGVYAHAADCRLEKAIPFNGDILSQSRTLEDAKTDLLPQFNQPEHYDPTRDRLQLDLFPIHWNGALTRILGANIGVLGKLEDVGFGQYLDGGSGFQTSDEQANGLRVITTSTSYEVKADSQEPGRQIPGTAVTRLTLTTQGQEIIGIQLTFPVYRFWKQGSLGPEMGYSGQNQTVCVTSAR